MSWFMHWGLSTNTPDLTETALLWSTLRTLKQEKRETLGRELKATVTTFKREV